MEDRLIVTASPHIRDASTTRGLMGNVVIALLPAVLAAGLIFGVQALVLVAVTTTPWATCPPLSPASFWR